MTIYIDGEKHCHVDNAEGRAAVDVTLFDGKCKIFVEGYICDPEDGLMITPFVDSRILDAAQAQYEEMLAQQQDMAKALEILEVTKE